jgi:uncharacterized membrane-anchored protein YjiN (DUF445 family)
MDFDELIKPYSENDRTVEMQVKWLLSKNIPRSFIDQALLVVYDEIERGKVFENGHELDRYLLQAAQDLYQAEVNDSVQKLQDFHNTLVQRHKDMAVEEVIARMQKPLNWLQRFGKWLFRL